MEKYDVAIIGGGSAGLAALKQLSNLGKQAILLEAGSEVGTKNLSGGILYSKKPQKGTVTNVEEIYENFLDDAPFERKITKYILHSTSKDKVYSMDLTAAHEYQSNFGYSVLLNKLNSWFAKQAIETAEKLGGGVIPGVHVKSISWNELGNAIIQTDELDDFEVKAVIAADGVNSEIADIVGARPKFTPTQLYQGVKVIIKLPEEIIEKRFGVSSDEGAAHLFAGDITLNHIGGGFLYTNSDTLSVGAVYHYHSQLENPTEPWVLIDALLKNPMISEFIKDDVPIKSKIDKSLPQEEQLRVRFAVAKQIKNWNEIRSSYFSSSGKKRLIDSGKYKSDEDIKTRLTEIEDQLRSLGVSFGSDYVEAEYGAKLVPDGKRCRMQKPFFKNILFVGDAAGRGIFVGPRIEGLNVGIDDGVRAANAVARAIDKNDFSENSLGEYYSKETENSPYTTDMKQIDKNYLKIFLDAAKDVPKDIIGARYGPILKMMSSGKLLGITVKFANILGYEKLLPMIESEDTYVKIPIQLAERLGKTVSQSYSPSIQSIADRIGNLSYNDDHLSHIKILNPKSEFIKKMVTLCPAKCYTEEEEEGGGGNVIIQHEGCVDCGTCSQETEWRHPRGEKGIHYKYG
ncbi:MAG: NAD(P)/FAD-dependent oxidoreductase [Nitrosopumilus sp.]|nr:NAD(P)/FAD-dependent oxidoreductase [Nitrosopumilus sp.]MDH3489267.1 NAD(P)/FAD-dependent oxidoreductase [Nitrosopumilus sp.]MDH3516265.1 NAD(P)/FAD-dependent oxidoreductase [Nitrosopumilus sp.]MDH3564031.1 NAD(P)/FAD-dependent oxidoreductase [Nitrosopumilus sp.]MDH5417347.1 NAD(P)/FAD-dependent oxidoreductase [Nitrosopumilus sp.]